MTLPEVTLWTVLRTRPAGLKFRRQHPLGPYVLDFYCPAARLAIEVDGAAHEMGRNPQRDIARDRWLSDQVVHTLRIPAKEVLENLDDVVRSIVSTCMTRAEPEN